MAALQILALLKSPGNLRLLRDFLPSHFSVTDIASDEIGICLIDPPNLVEHEIQFRRQKNFPLIGLLARDSKIDFPHRVQDLLAAVVRIPTTRAALLETIVDVIKSRDDARLLAEQYRMSRDDIFDLKREREQRENFVSMLSHDLRNPLRGARMTAQLLLRDADSEASREKINRIIANLARADRLIVNLLDANRLKANEPIPIVAAEGNLSEAVTEALKDQTAIHGERFHLTAPSLVIAEFSKEDVHRIIENLTGNAVKYGAVGSAIDVTIEDSVEEIFIRVHNWGAPISPLDQSSIFDMFSQTKMDDVGKQSGWGIGLALVRALSEGHGGEVFVSSSKIEGTTFTVKLPKRATR